MASFFAGAIQLSEITNSEVSGAKLDVFTPNRIYRLEAEVEADAMVWHEALAARRAMIAPALSADSAAWASNNEASACMQCTEQFTLLRRRHHCRFCGDLLCTSCAPLRKAVALKRKGGIRVCDACFFEINVSASMISVPNRFTPSRFVTSCHAPQTLVETA